MKTNYDMLTDEQKKMMMLRQWGICKDGNVKPCQGMPCSNCLLEQLVLETSISTTCAKQREKWLNETFVEYQIPKDTPIDTKVLVSNNGEEWVRRYFAGDFSKDGKAKVFLSGCTSWSNFNCSCTEWNYCKLAEE